MLTYVMSDVRCKKDKKTFCQKQSYHLAFIKDENYLRVSKLVTDPSDRMKVFRISAVFFKIPAEI